MCTKTEQQDGPQGIEATNLADSLLLTVVEEGTKETAVEMIQDGDQEQLIELES